MVALLHHAVIPLQSLEIYGVSLGQENIQKTPPARGRTLDQFDIGGAEEHGIHLANELTGGVLEPVDPNLLAHVVGQVVALPAGALG